MSGRSQSTSRHEQIVEATLELLGTTPLGDLTTRQIAKRIGVSQPALFRHFRSREQLLLAVVEHARASLGGLAETVVSRPNPMAALDALVHGLFAHVELHPGLPRLLFSEVQPVDGELARAVRQLVSMQLQLVTELVRQGQLTGTFVQGPPDQLAALLVAQIQGTILLWRHGAIAAPLDVHAAPLVKLWREGSRGDGVPRPAPPTAAQTVETVGTGLGELDVRPVIASGTDPIDLILAALEDVGLSGLLLLTAPFRPTPLIALLSRQDWTVEATEVDRNHWFVQISRPDAPTVQDLRDLPAPEPLEAVLLASATLAPGQGYLARVPRFPRLLLPRLQERGLTFRVVELHDGSAILHLRGPS